MFRTWFLKCGRRSLRNPTQRSGYRDFNDSAFTGWALEEALDECGAPLPSAR